MTTIKCRKCGKVYPFDEKICPVCGYDIRKDETLSPRDRAALGLKSDSALFDETNKENMERWKNQTKEERLEEAWENRNKFEIRPDQGGLPRLNVPMNTMLFLTVILIAIVFLAKYLGQLQNKNKTPDYNNNTFSVTIV